mmetsp:Transcript_3397/g.8744  ORF Transcript_3397/g.8744 Transcript_3397/m.8744 type:complete len:83 (+) Transcript_3397:1979-2227(+)
MEKIDPQTKQFVNKKLKTEKQIGQEKLFLANELLEFFLLRIFVEKGNIKNSREKNEVKNKENKMEINSSVKTSSNKFFRGLQ